MRAAGTFKVERVLESPQSGEVKVKGGRSRRDSSLLMDHRSGYKLQSISKWCHVEEHWSKHE